MVAPAGFGKTTLLQPDKLNELRGYPTTAKVPSQALDASNAARLWSESEKLTGVVFGGEKQNIGMDRCSTAFLGPLY
jgi:hypothetical protein